MISRVLVLYTLSALVVLDLVRVSRLCEVSDTLGACASVGSDLFQVPFKVHIVNAIHHLHAIVNSLLAASCLSLLIHIGCPCWCELLRGASCLEKFEWSWLLI
jgi:putative effector of murein hydrolase LrgA (UPF0299 family)